MSCHTLLNLHRFGLTGARYDILPHPTLGLDLFLLADNQRNRDVGKLIIAVTNEHVGPAGHAGMDSIIAQKQAKG